jgi:hypothetical protein
MGAPKRFQPLVVAPKICHCFGGSGSIARLDLVVHEIPEGVSLGSVLELGPSLARAGKPCVPLAHVRLFLRIPRACRELECLVEEVGSALSPCEEGPHLAQQKPDRSPHVVAAVFAKPGLVEKHPHQKILGQAAARMCEQAE